MLFRSHTYEDKGGTTPLKYQFITLSGSAEIINNYALFGSLDYDIDKKYTTSWQVGAKFTKKCWDYILAYRQKTELVQTSGGSNSRVTNALMLMFNFYPIGGVAYEYEFKRKNNDENI